jgi:hypothetical protein
MATSPEQFVAEARQALGERLKCVVLFGSAAAGDFLEGISQYDLLVVADPLGLAELEALAPVIRPWRKAGNPLPLLFTPGLLASSTDAFAIELLDMQDTRQVLHGDDAIAGLKIESAHVRIHLERELMGKSLLLRDRYVLAAGDERMIVTLLTDSLSTFLSLFRTALRLFQSDAKPAANISVPRRKLDALRALAEHTPFDPQPLLTIHDLKVQRGKIAGVDLKALYGQYWRAIDEVTQAVDRHNHPPA